MITTQQQLNSPMYTGPHRVISDEMSSSPPCCIDPSTELSILFGTQTGNSEEMSKNLALYASMFDIPCKVIDLDQVTPVW